MSRRSERHTVPNSDYLSFPCYNEEIKLTTNVIDCDEDNDIPDGTAKNIEVNVSMHDKLKMCFAEMENMKNRFENRRKKIQTKKSRGQSKSPVDQPAHQPAGTSEQQIPPKPEKSTLGPYHFKAKTSTQTQPTVNPKEEEDKFVAHLIRTSSKDSIEESEQPKSVDVVSESHVQEDSFQGNYPTPPRKFIYPKLNQNRRAASDPYEELNYRSSPVSQVRLNKQTIFSGGNYEQPFNTLQFNWSSNAPESRNDNATDVAGKNSSTRKSYDEWLQKLDEINDISRSTIERIKKLESDISNLKFDHPSKQAVNGVRVKPSRIPIIPKGSTVHAAVKVDKSINTDIDLQFMNKQLDKCNIAATAKSNGNRAKSEPVRRLTTVIGRSVEIQTDLGKKSVEDKSIETDDSLSEASKQPPPTEPINIEPYHILDLPNIESKSFPAESIRPTPTPREGKTPEPIIEMYSDSDDTSFEDFEKNIFNQISRRAMMNSRLQLNKRQPSKSTDLQPTTSAAVNGGHSSKFKFRNSSTQTIPKEIEREEETEQPPQSSFKKNLHSTSKIVIERTRVNQKEKSEIVFKTNIDKEGKVHRTTEVTNSKFKPMESQTTKVEPAFEMPAPAYDSESLEKLRKANSDMSFHYAKNIFPRPLSAFDLTDSDVMNKSTDDFISNKAFSSLDISAKSPVISEGYHSENLGPNQIHSSAEYLIDPPEPFQSDFDSKTWKEFSNSKVTNNYVNDIPESLADDYVLDKNNTITLTNETLIDSTGKKTNITTKSSTVRKYKPKDSAKTKSTLDLVSNSGHHHDFKQSEPNLYSAVSERNLNTKPEDQIVKSEPYRYHMPDYGQNQNIIMAANEPALHQPANICNLSFIYNYGNDIVLRANFGLSKLPLFETNL